MARLLSTESSDYDVPKVWLFWQSSEKTHTLKIQSKSAKIICNFVRKVVFLEPITIIVTFSGQLSGHNFTPRSNALIVIKKKTINLKMGNFCPQVVQILTLQYEFRYRRNQ